MMTARWGRSGLCVWRASSRTHAASIDLAFTLVNVVSMARASATPGTTPVSRIPDGRDTATATSWPGTAVRCCRWSATDLASCPRLSSVGCPSPPGGRSPRNFSAAAMWLSAVPCSNPARIRSPIRHSCRASRVTGIWSSVPCGSAIGANPHCCRRKCRGGWLRKSIRSARATSVTSGGAKAAWNILGGADGGRRSARAPVSASWSWLKESAGTSAPGVKLLGSNGCSGCRTTSSDTSHPVMMARVSSNSPTGTAGGWVRFVRRSRPA